jgi:hypothetical protein
VPDDTPVTTPAPGPGPVAITAMLVDPEVHVPPGLALLSVVVNPTHTEVIPDIGPGPGITVITVVGDAQPLE